LTPGNGDGGTFNLTITQYPGQAPEGQNVADSSFFLAGFLPPTISQVLSDVLTANTLYTLQVEVGNRLDTPFPGYVVQLLAGGVLLAEDNNSLSPADGTFATSTVTFTALPGDPNLGQPLEIRLRSFGRQTNFDDVRLTAVASAPTVVYIASGDSVAAGQDIDGQIEDKENAYPRWIRDYLSTDVSRYPSTCTNLIGTGVYNIADPGETTTDYLNNQLPAVIGCNPDLVSITIGANDLLQPALACITDNLERYKFILEIPFLPERGFYQCHQFPDQLACHNEPAAYGTRRSLHGFPWT
jgi:hypothetical protein